jgi:hypothetical protein
MTPAAADLHRRRQRDGRTHGSDDLLHQVQILQAARAAVSAHHLLDRAAEVDVEEVWLVRLLDERRGLGHCRSLGAKNLHPDRPLRGIETQIIPAPLGATAQTFRAYELADDDIRAEAPAQPPERRLADTGLRRQVERRVIVRKKIGKIHRHL